MDEARLVSPAALPLVTLDNNALVAIREHEPAETSVQEILAMNRAGAIAINVTLSTGLERSRSGQPWPWPEHSAWLESLGIAKVNIFTGPRTIGFVTPDEPGTVLFDTEREMMFNECIHTIFFPRIPFDWLDYLRRETIQSGLSWQAMAEYNFALRINYIPLTPQSPPRPPTPTYDALIPEQKIQIQNLRTRCYRVWNNVKNDALGFYNHLTLAWYTEHAEHSVFITSDRNLLRPTKLAALRTLGWRGEMLSPDDALRFLCTITGYTIV